MTTTSFRFHRLSFSLKLYHRLFTGLVIGRIAWQLFQMQTFGCTSLEEVFDLFIAVDERAVLDEQDFACSVCRGKGILPLDAQKQAVA
jgi:hypothetical protein